MPFTPANNCNNANNNDARQGYESSPSGARSGGAASSLPPPIIRRSSRMMIRAMRRNTLPSSFNPSPHRYRQTSSSVISAALSIIHGDDDYDIILSQVNQDSLGNTTKRQ